MENQTSNKEILNLGLRLLLITAVAGLILGFAHKITAEPIANQKKIENDAAMMEVLPTAEEFALKEVALEATTVTEVNEGLMGGEVAGYAIKVAPKGYGGLIDMMVGISAEGKVEGIKILSHSETPGLGANATNPGFAEQFKGKAIDNNLVVVKTGAAADNEISALTGATITSNSVTNAVNAAIKMYNTQLSANAGDLEEQKAEAMKEILPSAEEFAVKEMEIPEDSVVREVNEGKAASGVVGHILKVTPEGFGGVIDMIVAISNEGKIEGAKILSHSETPGYGQQAADGPFLNQYKGKTVDGGVKLVKGAAKTDNEVQAITGATITSNAVNKAISAALEFYNAQLKGGQ